MTQEAAYTQPGPTYPGYINARPVGVGMIGLTFRGEPGKSLSGLNVPGDTARFDVPFRDWRAFLVKALAELDVLEM